MIDLPTGQTAKSPPQLLIIICAFDPLPLHFSCMKFLCHASERAGERCISAEMNEQNSGLENSVQFHDGKKGERTRTDVYLNLDRASLRELFI